MAFARRGADEGSFRFELYHEGGANEPMAELELADTQFNQIEVVWVTLQDPLAHRYDIDILPGGDTTMRGTAGRNLVAEEGAMMAGLAPGQVRRGLRAFKWLAERIETLMLCLNQHEYMAQPLFYHTAVLFEQYGFSYVQGQGLMEEVHSASSPAASCMPGWTIRRHSGGRARQHHPRPLVGHPRRHHGRPLGSGPHGQAPGRERRRADCARRHLVVRNPGSA